MPIASIAFTARSPSAIGCVESSHESKKQLFDLNVNVS